MLGRYILTTDPETHSEMLEWTTERGSKTRTGAGENQHQRAFNPKLHAVDSSRCGVKLYKTFLSHRPKEMLKPDSPFFLAEHISRKPDSQIWFKRAPLGKNKIGQFLSTVSPALSGNKKISNHSVRKTSISRLLDANFPETYVAQLSGHKSLESLKVYKTPSLQHQRDMSYALSKASVSSAEKLDLQVPSSQVVPQSKVISQSQSQVALQQIAGQSTKDTPASVAVSASSVPGFMPTTYEQQVTMPSRLPASVPSAIFTGSSIGFISNCTFNIALSAQSYGESSQSVQQTALPKRRRVLSFDSDSD